jgi:hypothetical protein
VRAQHVRAGAEGLDGGDDVDSDAEERGGGRDDTEVAADDEEQVGASAHRLSFLPSPRVVQGAAARAPRVATALRGRRATLQVGGSAW